MIRKISQSLILKSVTCGWLIALTVLVYSRKDTDNTVTEDIHKHIQSLNIKNDALFDNLQTLQQVISHEQTGQAQLQKQVSYFQHKYSSYEETLSQIKKNLEQQQATLTQLDSDIKQQLAKQQTQINAIKPINVTPIKEKSAVVPKKIPVLNTIPFKVLGVEYRDNHYLLSILPTNKQSKPQNMGSILLLKKGQKINNWQLIDIDIRHHRAIFSVGKKTRHIAIPKNNADIK